MVVPNRPSRARHNWRTDTIQRGMRMVGDVGIRSTFPITADFLNRNPKISCTIYHSLYLSADDNSER